MYKISDCQLFSNKRVAKGFSVNLIPNLIPRVLHLPAPLGQEERVVQYTRMESIRLG